MITQILDLPSLPDHAGKIVGITNYRDEIIVACEHAVFLLQQNYMQEFHMSEIRLKSPETLLDHAEKMLPKGYKVETVNSLRPYQLLELISDAMKRM